MSTSVSNKPSTNPSTNFTANPPTNSLNGDEDFYLFGYGSLIWKMEYEFKSKQWGYIHGFSRTFLQRSIDHRGTKWNAGRVCTLRPTLDSEKKCWGVVYRICKSIYHQILEDLDIREKGGYSKRYCSVYDEKGQSITQKCLLYYGDGLEAIQSEPIEKTASIIANSVGPSGPNIEYLYKLTHALRERSLLTKEGDDSYLLELETLVKEYDEKKLCYISSDIKKDEFNYNIVLKMLNKMKKETIETVLGVRMIYASKNRVKSRVVITQNHSQPADILHGGMNVVLGEACCSFGSMINCQKGFMCVGQEINCNHLKSVPVNKSISITCIATPIRIGRSSQVWEFKVVQDGTGDLIATGRMTASIVPLSRI